MCILRAVYSFVRGAAIPLPVYKYVHGAMKHKDTFATPNPKARKPQDRCVPQD